MVSLAKADTSPSIQHRLNLGLASLIDLIVLSSYHTIAIQYLHIYKGGPKFQGSVNFPV
jgi:hypothetical protein